MKKLLLAPLFAGLAIASASAKPAQQHPLLPAAASSENNAANSLHGRFLHITDFHPDRFYSQLSSTDSDDACHWGVGSAGIFGTEKSDDCDSPIALINATFQWINDNLKDTIDFVVWTGDSARHDNDELIPRTEEQVIELNEFLVAKFVQVFGKEDNINDTDPTNDFTIPIIPNFGNNDILPHNIFTPGPNRWTKAFAHIWRNFIPEEQRHGFERGGWFFVEVVPDRLAVFSLNTLYFFNSNTAVDGCADPSEPGYEHFEWLRVQLQFIRRRGMKAILTGHVPPARTPNKQSWDETCWQKYTLWLQQYRDIIVGGLYGHMNIDHFMLQDHHDIDMSLITGELEPTTRLRPLKGVFIQSSAEYLTELRYGWSNLPGKVEPEKFEARSGIWPSFGLHPTNKERKSKHDKYLEKIGGPWGERYSATFVGPSVVPNYFPTMRIFEYNTTAVGQSMIPPSSECFEGADTAVVDVEGSSKHKGSKKPKFVQPHPPSKAEPPGPAYSPQTFSLLGYTQYYANLTKINAAFAWPQTSSKVQFAYEVEYDTKNDSVFGLPDLTVRNYIDLAARIGQYKPKQEDLCLPEGSGAEAGVSASKNTKHKKHKKNKKRKAINRVWFTFIDRAFVGAKDEEDIRDQFGVMIDD
ncbi:MAG: hypothetical protein Q9220_006180 [cf. Caloplaca sp. 1 TL-2023]